MQRYRKCIIKDDMQMIYQKLFEADRIILATPVFFATVSTHAKILIDRCQALWAKKYLLGHTHKRNVPLLTERACLFL